MSQSTPPIPTNSATGTLSNLREPARVECLAPAPGTRIEVYWVVEQDDGQHESLWWGATVAGTSAKPEEDIGGYVTTLQYDAAVGFEASEELVVFLSEGELMDVSRREDENGGVLNWRLEGADEQVRGESCGRAVTMLEVAEAQVEMDREVGVSAVDMGMRAMATLPWEQQMAMAQTYRAFAEHVKGKLARLKEEKGKGYEVSQQDVDGIFEELGGKPPPAPIGPVF